MFNLSANEDAGADQVRTAVRFPMVLPLVIVTESETIEAMTENISANGILFNGRHLPGMGRVIRFTIKMPAAVMGAEQDVLIQCVGRVVRHEQKGAMQQAAAIIDDYSLRV